MRHLRQIARSFAFLMLSQGIAVVSSFALLAVLARWLAPEEFGLYGLATAWACLLVPLPFAGTTRVFEREAARRPEDLPMLLANVLSLRLALGGLVTGATTLVAIAIPRELTVLLALSSLWAALGALSGAYSEVYVILGRTHLEAAQNALYKIALVALALAAVAMGWGVVGIFAAKAIARGAEALAMALHAHRRVIPLRLAWSPSCQRMLLKEGWPLQASEVLQMAIFRIDELLLGLLGSLVSVGVFHGPYQVFLGLSLLPQQIMRAAYPTLSQGIGEAFTLRRQRALVGVSMAAGTAVFLGLHLTAEPLTLALLGPGYEASAPVLGLLSFAAPLLYLEIFLRFNFAAEGRQSLDARCVAWGLGVNILLDVILIPWYGFWGAAIATVAAQGVVALSATWMQGQELRRSIAGQLLLMATAWTAGALLPGLWRLLALAFALGMLLPVGAFLGWGPTASERTWTVRKTPMEGPHVL